ncbi:MAG TPA: multidrug efflux RND transporter permease subunit [Hyphomicrobiaceae bacterium]|nr:multidrug efflux RND transporter permease subunit [Hyphomicrobiaceae bacterium]
MRLSQFFIHRPIFAAVISLVITIVGFVSYNSLAVNQLPEIVPPTVIVSTSYPGASAQTIADTVAAPIEQEINGVEGMIYMYSQSTNDGSVSITVSFDIGTDIDRAQVLVQNRVQSAERRLPEEVRRNGVTVRKRSPDVLLSIHLLSPDNTYDQVYISNYGLLNVRDRLMRVEGVGDVSLFGAREYAMRIWLDPEKIAARNLTAEEVLAALRAQNVQVAGGNIGEPPIETQSAFQLALQLKGRLRTAEEFNDIIVRTTADGRVVRLRDVGRAELGAVSYSQFGYANKVPATVLVVAQQPGSNAVAASHALKQEMAEIAKSFPPGLTYRITYNPTEFIEISIKELYISILEAVGLVVLVVLLFLQTWRATIIPVVAIPISLIGTFTVMQTFGFSLNMLTLFGLVLAVGIVVDDAIVVVENVERKLHEGLTPMEASEVSMNEVGAALIAIALVLTSVFVPTAFVPGITGQFYRQFAVTIATATVISAFVSLTLSPALAARLLTAKDHDDKPGLVGALMRPIHKLFAVFNRGFDALSRGYGRLVRALAAAWVPVLFVYAGLVAFAFWFVPQIPTGFIPNLDRQIAIVSIQLPPGASVSRTDEVVKRANDILLQVPGVKYTNAFTGRNGATFTAATNAGSFFVVLDDFENRRDPSLHVNAVAQVMRQKLGAIQEANIQVFVPPPVRGMGGSAGFSMRLQDKMGLDSEAFAQIGRSFIAAANQHPAIQNAFTTFAANNPQMFMDVDRDKAQMLRVPIDRIFESLRVYMGSAYVNDFNMFGRTYRVTAQAEGDFRLDPENINRIRVRSIDGAMVPLGSVVQFREISGPERVPRYNLFPTIEVQGAARPGISSGQALQIMQQLALEHLPDGIGYEWTDLSYQEAKVGRAGYYIFAFSVLFVFLALAAQYESWSLPFAIMLIVPMCLLSAAFGVWLHGRDINILTQIGFVVLIGLAAKNAILIVEFAKQLEEEGRDTLSAAVEACRLRLRPIIMTSLAFTLGVVPLYIAVGAGAELRVALGTAVFWGMIGVTLFGLLFTPVFYVVIRRLFPRGVTTRKSNVKDEPADAVPSPAPAE